MCPTRLILHTSPLNYVGAFCHQSGSSFSCLNLWWMSGCIERESWILWDVSFTCLGRCAFDQCGHTAWSRHLPTVGYRDLPKTLFSKSEFFWLAALFQHEDQVLLWWIWTFDFNCRSYRTNNSIIIHKYHLRTCSAHSGQRAGLHIRWKLSRCMTIDDCRPNRCIPLLEATIANTLS